jgi:hypothetical protein
MLRSKDPRRFKKLAVINQITQKTQSEQSIKSIPDIVSKISSKSIIKDEEKVSTEMTT